MLASASDKMGEWKHPYGSVQQEASDKPRRTSRFALMCVMGLTILAVAAVLVGVVVREQAMTPTKGAIPSTKGVVGHQLASTGSCDPDQEKFVASAATCVVCLNPNATPKLTPQQCPPGTYYDEEYTCSCVPCLKNCCCPGGDVLEGCPIGSFQPNTGEATCLQAVVSSQTNPFSYSEKRPLFTDKQKAVELNTLTTAYINCPGQGIGKAAAVISGFNMASSNDLFSIQVDAVMVEKQSARVTVSKLPGSQIAGFATSLALTCVPPSSVMSLDTMRTDKLTAEKKVRIVKTTMKCDGAEPQVFAALNEIESSASGKRLSVSLKSSTRTNNDGLVRTRLEFSSGSNAAALGASVVTFCASPESMLAPGMIQTGLVNGGAISPNQKVVKIVELKNAMKCKNPRVALGLTQLDATGTLAINLELLPSSSTTSFRMAFVSMGPTTVRSIQAAYLVSCRMDPNQVQADINKVCPPRVF